MASWNKRSRGTKQSARVRSTSRTMRTRQRFVSLELLEQRTLLSISNLVLAPLAPVEGQVVSGDVASFTGSAPSSNVFVLGDMSSLGGNVQGQVTVGGNGTFRAGNLDSIYDQGNLSVTAVNVSGSVLYGGTFTGLGSNIGSSSQIMSPLFDFVAAGQSLPADSALLGSLPTNGVISTDIFGNVTLTGTDPNLNVFEIAPPGVNASVQIVAPPGSNVLVNVDGYSPDITLAVLNGLTANTGAFDPSHVLFNFPEATSLAFSSSTISGTILAPQAYTTTTSATIYGSLITSNLSILATHLYDQPFAGQDLTSFASTSDFSAIINWGDGNTSNGTIGFDSALNCFTVSGSHTYAQAGTYSSTVSIQDQWGATATATATAVVADAPLSASGLSLSGTEGTTLGGTLADFNDPNSFASTSDFSAVITWGDGHSSAGTIGYDAAHKTFTVSGSNTYTQAGSYHPAISIHDLGGASALAIATATVADAPLIATGLSFNATEGTAFSGVLATFTDPNPLATPSSFTASITWGDGHSSAGTIGYDAAHKTFTVSGSNTYTQAGSYRPAISIHDLGGASALAIATATVADAPLTASGLSFTATEGTAFSGVLATFTDPNPLATPSSFTASITWGDGHSSAGTIGYDAAHKTFTVSGSNTYTQAGSYRPAISIHDLGGASALAIATATVADAPLTASGLSFTATEGTAFSGVLATFTDPNPLATPSSFTASITWGDGHSSAGTIGYDAAHKTFTVSGSNTYTQAGSYRPAISIHDLGGASALAIATATVADAPLTASGLSFTATEGTAFSGVLATFTDPNPLATPSSFTASITWGDGHSSAGTIGYDAAHKTFTVSGSNTYTQAGSYRPAISIHDLGGASALAIATATVADAPLTASGPSFTATEGTAFSGVLATFTDPNPLATPSSFTASITWGDGHSSAGTIGYDAAHKTFTVSGSNTYTQAGSYRPAISIHDLGGASALAIATATVADAPLIATGLNIIAVRAVRFTDVVATFIDVNPAESSSNFTAKINWGAGQARLGKITQPGGPGTSFLVTGTHRYSRAGKATIKVSISEKSGIQSARTTGKVRVLSENPHRTNPRHPFIPRRRV